MHERHHGNHYAKYPWRFVWQTSPNCSDCHYRECRWNGLVRRDYPPEDVLHQESHPSIQLSLYPYYIGKT